MQCEKLKTEMTFLQAIADPFKFSFISPYLICQTEVDYSL